MYEDGRTSPVPARPAEPRSAATASPNIIAEVARRWILIAVLGLVGSGMAYMASRMIAPRFMSTAQIFVDPRGLQVFDNELTPRQQDSNTAINFVESQARIVTSQSVLARVIDGERLTEDPEFNGQGGASWAANLLGSLGLRRGGEESLQARERLALNALYDRVIVRRPERTFVIEVTVRAGDPDKAARLANAVAHAYIDSQTEARSETARRATQALTNRLDELRSRVRTAEERAEDFRRRNGLVGTRTQLVSEQQLTDANTQLAQAQARAGEALARNEQIQRALRSNGAASALPEAVISPTIAALRGQQAEARRRLADASTEYGPRHPTVRNAQAQVSDLDRAITEELARIAQSARADLDRARAAETSQRRAVDQLITQASDAGQAFVQLRELQREVDVNRNLLNAFLARSRETSELERLDTNNARIITVAQPPRDRVFPPRGVVLAMAGFIGGAGLGVGIALLLALLKAGFGVTPAGSSFVRHQPPVARLV
ncbi:MAG: GumC family protein [Phreatobacter sp.]|uniref:GumC family protein n=1 Tax=Phreatobacter sp. TaxID=1966341 RepID=UPI001A36948E|nr:GumC family protein [Phreatobacter sp.]MBL8569687.1 GumC family protein [Phreatobacter sp.]